MFVWPTLSKLSFGFAFNSPGKVISVSGDSGPGSGDGGDSGDSGSDGLGFVEANEMETGQMVNAVGIKIPPQNIKILCSIYNSVIKNFLNLICNMKPI